MQDANACGNQHIDGLAQRGRLQAIWQRLEHKFPELAPHSEEIWLARRDGRFRRFVEREPRFAPLMNQTGPETEAEWLLLRDAVLEVIIPAEMHRCPWCGKPCDCDEEQVNVCPAADCMHDCGGYYGRKANG